MKSVCEKCNAVQSKPFSSNVAFKLNASKVQIESANCLSERFQSNDKKENRINALYNGTAGIVRKSQIVFYRNGFYLWLCWMNKKTRQMVRCCRIRDVWRDWSGRKGLSRNLKPIKAQTHSFAEFNRMISFQVRLPSLINPRDEQHLPFIQNDHFSSKFCERPTELFVLFVFLLIACAFIRESIDCRCPPACNRNRKAMQLNIYGEWVIDSFACQ